MADLNYGRRIPPGYVYDQIEGMIPAPPAKKPFNTGKNITGVLGDLWDESKLQGMAPEFTEMGSLPNLSVITGNASKGLGLLGNEIRNSTMAADLGQSAENYLSRMGGLLHAVDPTDTAKLASRQVATPKTTDVASRFQAGGKAGIYRGSEAFGGITPQKLGSMRQDYLKKMEQGTAGRNWYDDSSADINRWVGGDASEADKLANILAITSSRTPVSSNLMYANKGWNQLLAADELKTGGFPTAMGDHIKEAISNPEASATGLKRSPFSAGLSVDWRGPDFANRATHDIHDVRAWGITDPKTGEPLSKGVGDAGHRFLDEQSNWVTQQALKNNLGGVSDWTPYRAQAAAWIAQKAQKEGKPISETAKHYGSFANDYQGLISREWVPGDNTGHLQEVLSAPESVQKAYSQAMEQNIRGPQGIDQFARDVGALSDRVNPNIGFYEGASNPAYISRIGVGKDTGSQAIDPSSAKVMQAVTAGHGLLGTQKQSAWNYLGGEVPIKSAGGIKLRGNDLNEAQFKEFAKKIQDIGGDVPMYDPEGGVRLLSFASPEEKVAFSKKLKPLAKEYGLTPTYHELSSDIYPFETTDQWSSKPYIKAIEDSGLESQVSKALQKHAGGLLDTTNEFTNTNNWVQAKWYKPMMEALRDGGLPKLKGLVDAGVVPAAVYMDLSKQNNQKK
jgi:hypothetical protein